MSDGLRNVIIFVIVAGLLGASYFFYNNGLKSKVLKELAAEKVLFDAVVSSLEDDASILPVDFGQAPVRYLNKVLLAIKGRSFVGLSVFNQSAKEGLYDDFIQRSMIFRDALVAYTSTEPMTNLEKKNLMLKVVSSCERIFTQVLGEDKADLKTDAIYKKWTAQDRQKLNIRDDELPAETIVAAREASEKDSERSDYSQFNVQDGKTMTGEETEVAPEKREPVPEKVRAALDIARLSQHIGEQIEVHRKNGVIHEGKLMEVNETSLTLDVPVIGGNFSLNIQKTDIDKIYKLTPKKPVASPLEE